MWTSKALSVTAPAFVVKSLIRGLVMIIITEVANIECLRTLESKTIEEYIQYCEYHKDSE